MNNNTLIVKNAEGEPDTQAQIIIQNKIDYTPKVSVIIPVYNTEEYLRECMDSVINQTLKEIEIICVDDGSTDGSLEILKEYAKKDERITVVTQQNLHAGVARNAGLSVAKGEYLSFLDSDDFFELEMLENMLNKAEIDESDIVICNYDWYIDNKGIYKPSYPYKDKYIKKSPFSPDVFINDLYFISTPNAWTKLFKSSLIEKKRIRFENLLSCNDITFVNTALSLAHKISITNESFIHYRVDSGCNISATRENKCLCIIDAMLKLEHNLKKNNIYTLYKQIFESQFLVRCAAEQLKANAGLKAHFSNYLKLKCSKDFYIRYLDMVKPKVSIIIPVYNTEEYLRECMDSVVNQTLKNIEIICIDDCSTDGSYRILEEYAARDGRIKLLRNDQNLGAPGAVKNIGIKEAEGEYIGFVDSDDYVDLNYFEELYSLAQNHDSDIAASLKMTYFGKVDSCRIIKCPKKVLVTAQDKQPLIKMSGSNCSKIYRREMIKKNNISCCEVRNVAEDNYFSMLAMVMANCIVTTSKAGYYYRRHDNSVTSHSRTNNDFAIFDIYKSIDEYIVHNIENSTKQQEYMNSINQRKIQDFTWFKADCDLNYLEEFKSRLKSQFPEIYNRVFIPDIIISLTSYPARINTVHLTIESLLNQSMKADKVILWLAPEQFPNKDADLPRQLLDLRERGLTIDWYHDIKSYKKLIPALKKYPDAIIVTADDDLLYDRNWLKLLYDSYMENPNDINCHRAHRFEMDNGEIKPYTKWRHNIHNTGASYLNFCTSGAGCLYPPHCFNNEIFNETMFKAVCKNADDIWFWAMVVLNHKKIRVINNNIPNLKYIDGTQETALWNTNKVDNDRYIANVIEAYPEILNLLEEETDSSPLLYKDIGLGCNTWCEPRNVSGNAYTYDLSDNIYTRYVSWDPIKEGSCDVEILRLSAVEKRSGRVVEFPVDKIISSGKISGRRVEFRNQKCWIGCAVEGAYESFTVEASVSRV